MPGAEAPASSGASSSSTISAGSRRRRVRVTGTPLPGALAAIAAARSGSSVRAKIVDPEPVRRGSPPASATCAHQVAELGTKAQGRRQQVVAAGPLGREVRRSAARRRPRRSTAGRRGAPGSTWSGGGGIHAASPPRRCRSSRRRGAPRREERHVGAEARQRGEVARGRRFRSARGAPTEAPCRRRVRRAAAEPGAGRDPLLERQAGQLRLPAEPRHQAAPGEVAAGRPGSRPPADASTRSPVAPGSSSSRSASSSSTISVSSRWKPSGRRPTTRSERFSLAGASRLSGVNAARRVGARSRASAPSWPVEALPLGERERLGAALRVDPARRERLGQRRSAAPAARGRARCGAACAAAGSPPAPADRTARGPAPPRPAGVGAAAQAQDGRVDIGRRLEGCRLDTARRSPPRPRSARRPTGSSSGRAARRPARRPRPGPGAR